MKPREWLSDNAPILFAAWIVVMVIVYIAVDYSTLKKSPSHNCRAYKTSTTRGDVVTTLYRANPNEFPCIWERSEPSRFTGEVAVSVEWEDDRSWAKMIGASNYSHIVQIIKEQHQARAHWTEAGYYPGGKDLQGRPYKAKGMVCAANIPKFGNLRGKMLRITRPGYGSIVVRCNDFGPDRKVFPDRGIDLSPDAARVLGMLRCGVAKVYVEVLE